MIGVYNMDLKNIKIMTVFDPSAAEHEAVHMDVVEEFRRMYKGH